MSNENLIPEGTYRAVATPVPSEDGPLWAQFDSKANEQGVVNDYVVINFELLDGPAAGRRLAWWGYFTEATTDRTMEAMRYIGWKGNNLIEAPFQALDQEVSLVIEHEEWGGKTRAKVRWVNRPGGGGIGFKLEKRMDKKQLTAFAQRMKAKAAGTPEVDGARADRTARPANGAHAGLDAPFAPPTDGVEPPF